MSSTSELFICPWTIPKRSQDKHRHLSSNLQQKAKDKYTFFFNFFLLLSPPQIFILHSVTTSEFPIFQITGCLLAEVTLELFPQGSSVVQPSLHFRDPHLCQASPHLTFLLPGREHPFSLLPRSFGNKLVFTQPWHYICLPITLIPH